MNSSISSRRSKFYDTRLFASWISGSEHMEFSLRNCAFVNFTNISNAIKAIEGIKTKPDYANLRIAHGKDRCANPPRSGPQGGSSMRRSASANGPQSALPLSAVDQDADGVDPMHSDAVTLGEQEVEVDSGEHAN